MRKYKSVLEIGVVTDRVYSHSVYIHRFTWAVIYKKAYLFHTKSIDQEKMHGMIIDVCIDEGSPLYYPL